MNPASERYLVKVKHLETPNKNLVMHEIVNLQQMPKPGDLITLSDGSKVSVIEAGKLGKH